MGKDKNNQDIPEGYLKDYISGEIIKATPEEVEATQPYSRILVEDYGYGVAQIQTRPQYRVKTRPSGDNDYPVDIAVFKDKDKTEDNLWIIVECKQKKRKKGKTQLQDYLRLCKAPLGVWFNGAERLYLRKLEKGGKILFEEIPNIPRCDERIEDVGLFRRNHLKKIHNLRDKFVAIRNYLAPMAVGTTRDEVLAQQLINLVFCKIFDERFTAPNEIVSFRAGIDEAPNDVKRRVIELFEGKKNPRNEKERGVKGKYWDVLDKNDSIDLDARSIYFVVGELQDWCIHEADRDAVADAFETFIGPALKGAQGQFFTPRNVIKTLINIVDPEPNQLIIDPACGSGGFLIESLRHVWDKIEMNGKKLNWSQNEIDKEKGKIASECFFGIDKDYFLSKVTKAYMAIVGDGKGGIFCENSLEPITTWENKVAKTKIALENFDVVFTNPPFGSKIKIDDEHILVQYKLGHNWKKEKDTFIEIASLKEKEEPQVLFIERCLQLLRDGGHLGIVLPETYFHAPNSRYILHFIKKHNIKAVVDLAHNTFRPNCNAKTMLLVIQKNRPQGKKIIMAVAEEVGHDHNAKPIFRYDWETKKFTDEIWDDTLVINKEVAYPEKDNNKSCFIVSVSNIKNDVFVPRYYWKSKENELRNAAQKMGLGFIPVSELIGKSILTYSDGHGSPPGKFKGKGEVPYIRVSDIVNWEIYRNPTTLIPYDVYKDIKGANGIDLQEKDILYVRRGSYRIGTLAMASPFDKEVLLTRELVVLRILNEKNEYDITPFYLIYLLSHELTQKQLYNKVLIETTLPNIGDRWKETFLPIHKDRNERIRIGKKVESAFIKKWDATKEINLLRTEFGNLTT